MILSWICFGKSEPVEREHLLEMSYLLAVARWAFLAFGAMNKRRLFGVKAVQPRGFLVDKGIELPAIVQRETGGQLEGRQLTAQTS
jgi:hypothetical protein